MNRRRLSVAIATIAATAIAGVGIVSAQENTDNTSISSTSSLSSTGTDENTPDPEAPGQDNGLSSQLLEWNDNPEVVETLEWLGVGVTIIAAVTQAFAVAVPIIRYFNPGFLR